MRLLPHLSATGTFFSIIVLLISLPLGGCAPGWLASWAPDQSPHSSTYVPGQGIVRTYFYGTPVDPLGSVHQYRPDIYHRFYGGRHEN